MYHLWVATLQDVAGNAAACMDTRFGGVTDFAGLLGRSTTITVNP